MPPPPIPQRKEVTAEVQNEGSNPPPIPVRSPKRRPAGAVATAMVSGQGSSGQGSLTSAAAADPSTEKEVEDQEHANNPYDLKATPGSNVTASYPFHGDDNLQQLSFAVGDVIKLKQKEEMWSWGVLERSGKEGWFPHNYVGTTFKPLPGIHEMAAKIRERRERLDAAQAQEDAAKNSNPAQDGQSASEVEVALPGSTAAAGSPGVTTGATSEEGLQSLSENVSSGSSSKSESSETGAGPTDSAAQPGGTVGGGVANGAAVEESGSGADADPPSKAEEAADPGPAAATSSKGGASAGPQISSAPSLPPFFKAAPAANDAAATVVAPPTTGAVGEAGAAEVVDGAQIDGVGFAGQAEAAGTGCKCCIM